MTGDNPETGPLNIDQYLDMMTAPEGQAEEVEETPEPEAEPEAEAETEVEAEAEAAEQDEPTESEEPPEAYDITEYGEVKFRLRDGTLATAAELEAGILRQADYSRKTMSLAEERKALEAAKQELALKERQLIEQFATLEEPEPDWRKLAEEDPLGWQLQRLEWEKKQGEKQAKRREAEALRAKELEDFRRFTAQKAVEIVPEWMDPKAYAQSADMRREAVLAAGFTEAEYNNSPDFRWSILAYWAAKGRAAEQKVATTQKKLANVPKVVKPGTMSVKAEREAAERAAREKRIRGPVTATQYLDLKGIR